MACRPGHRRGSAGHDRCRIEDGGWPEPRIYLCDPHGHAAVLSDRVATQGVQSQAKIARQRHDRGNGVAVDPRGRDLLITANETGGVRLIRMPISGGSEPAGERSAARAEGRRAIFYVDSGTVWSVPAGDGEPRKIRRSVPPSSNSATM